MSILICLANSRKLSDRCVAGIEISTGKWLRPVTRSEDGRIPFSMTCIDGTCVQPLDIVDIPLSPSRQGYECENRIVLSAAWTRVGKAHLKYVSSYCENKILYENDLWLRAVPYTYLTSLPPDKRRTLQIIEVSNFQVWRNDYGKWRGAIPLKNGQRLISNITDPELCAKLDDGYIPNHRCLIVLSLSQPWKKPESEGELLCYRLISSVLEV